jgi:hypothetical protein
MTPEIVDLHGILLAGIVDGAPDVGGLDREAR